MIDRHNMLLGGFARRAVSSIKTNYDHGRHRQQRHDVSQENGLRERGTTAMCRMEPPHSGQMAKSLAVSCALSQHGGRDKRSGIACY